MAYLNKVSISLDVSQKYSVVKGSVREFQSFKELTSYTIIFGHRTFFSVTKLVFQEKLNQGSCVI